MPADSPVAATSASATACLDTADTLPLETPEKFWRLDSKEDSQLVLHVPKAVVEPRSVEDPPKAEDTESSEPTEKEIKLIQRGLDFQKSRETIYEQMTDSEFEKARKAAIRHPMFKDFIRDTVGDDREIQREFKSEFATVAPLEELVSFDCYVWETQLQRRIRRTMRR